MIKYLTITLFLFSSFLIKAQTNIAHLNSQEVMAAMPSYERAVKKLDDFQKELFVELQEMRQDFETELAEYQDLVAKGGSETLIRIQEQKLTTKQAEIQTREQAVQGEIEAYSRELNYPIINKIDKAVNIVADRHNYLYVFDISTIMIANGPDITQEVIKEIMILENAPPPQEEIKEVEVTRP